MGNKKTAKKKSPKRKRCAPSRPSGHVEEAPEAGEEILTQEGLMERVGNIRRASAEAAGLERHPPIPQTKIKGPVIPPFNPKFPPAGLPSLLAIKQPIVTGTTEKHSRQVKGDRERCLKGLGPLRRDSYHLAPIEISGQDDAPNTDKPASQEPAEISASYVEHKTPGRATANLEASDFVLHLVHSSNKAVVVDKGQMDTSDANEKDLAYRSDLDFSDTDDEIILETNASVPKWDDLSPSLQAEIADNILENENWKDAAGKLGLTQKQRRMAKRFARRYEQALEREDKEMERMRDDQLRYLLRMDNSKIQGDQAERILAKIASRSQQKLLEHPDRDLKKCKFSDLRKAWCFLNEHGLPWELAGVWSNGVEEIRPAEDTTPLTKRVRWTDLLTTPEELRPMQTEAVPAHNRSLAEKTNFLNSFGDGSSIAPPTPARHPIENIVEHLEEWERLFTESDENRAHLARERRLRLAHGAGGAADIMANQNGPALPEPLVAQYRYNQRIKRAKREAEERAAATYTLSFTGRDITERTWEEGMEARYDKLANDSAKLFHDYDSHPDVHYEENSELDEEALGKLLEVASQFNKECRGLAKSGSSSRPEESVK
ncbi:hypothetical protein F1880_006392 [Penicillium rolfsii]|nr:hypothetical protein F1880_006392 [Penicillium rolfsii]